MRVPLRSRMCHNFLQSIGREVIRAVYLSFDVSFLVLSSESGL